MTNKQLEKAVQSHFEVPEDIQRLVGLATSDLLWGPVSLGGDWEEDNYKGFQSACKRIREYVDTLPSQLWIDTDCDCVMTSEPQGEEVDGEWVEPLWESIYYVNGRNEVVELLFNHYLAGYV